MKNISRRALLASAPAALAFSTARGAEGTDPVIGFVAEKVGTFAAFEALENMPDDEADAAGERLSERLGELDGLISATRARTAAGALASAWWLRCEYAQHGAENEINLACLENTIAGLTAAGVRLPGTLEADLARFVREVDAWRERFIRDV